MPDQSSAITVFENLVDALPKSAEFFVDFSVALLRHRDAKRAEKVASEGLSSWPEDRDLLGASREILLDAYERWNAAFRWAKTCTRLRKQVASTVNWATRWRRPGLKP
jgi:hypothetical protein